MKRIAVLGFLVLLACGSSNGLPSGTPDGASTGSDARADTGSSTQEGGSDGASMADAGPAQDAASLDGGGGDAANSSDANDSGATSETGGTDSSTDGFASPDAADAGPPLDSGPSEAGMICTPGATECQATVLETCDPQGTGWNQTTCPYVCLAGACAGVCSPGSMKCSGTLSQTCDGSGSWTTTATCPYVCTGAGVCSGTCVPGTNQCSGQNAQTCDSSGTWQTTATCPYACVSGGCTGVCVPGSVQCASSTQTETCGSNGEWQNPTTCPSVPNATPTCSGGVCGLSCDSGYTDCNGACVNLASDSNNCGSCGRSCCGGGACSASHCQLAALSLPTNAFDDALAVDDVDVYWAPAGGSEVDEAPYLTGSPATVLQQGQSIPSFVVSNGTTVFWSDQGVNNGMGYWIGSGVFGTPVGGGAITTIASDGIPEGYVTYDAQSIFWTDEQNYNVWWAALSGTPSGLVYPESFGVSLYGQVTPVWDFASDGAYVYATFDATRSSVWRTPVRGGTATQFATIPNDGLAHQYSSMAQDGVNLYAVYMDGATPSNDGLWQLPLSGSTPTQLVSGVVQSGLATDGSSVYYFQGTGPKDLKKAPVGGGPVTTLASLGSDPAQSQFDRPRLNSSCVFAYDPSVATSSGWVTVNKNP